MPDGDHEFFQQSTPGKDQSGQIPKKDSAGQDAPKKDKAGLPALGSSGKLADALAADTAKNAPPTAGTEPAAPPLVTEVKGVQIVANGASEKAVAELVKIVEQLIAKNPYAQKKFKDDKVTLVIIPHDKKMTDLPQFAALKGKTTFDGRVWDNVRGSGGMPAPDGSYAIGVAEENLTEIKGVVDGYGKDYSVAMHETAHTLQKKGLTDEQGEQVKKLYQARKAKADALKAEGKDTSKIWTDAYASSNDREYFAQCTNAFFGKNKIRATDGNGPEWLKENDPDMHKFLTDLYTKDHDEAGKIKE